MLVSVSAVKRPPQRLQSSTVWSISDM
jgi:hypothetical protein